MSGKPFPRPANPKPMLQRKMRRLQFVWLSKYCAYTITDTSGIVHHYSVTIDTESGNRSG